MSGLLNLSYGFSGIDLAGHAPTAQLDRINSATLGLCLVDERIWPLKQCCQGPLGQPSFNAPLAQKYAHTPIRQIMLSLCTHSGRTLDSHRNAPSWGAWRCEKQAPSQIRQGKASI